MTTTHPSIDVEAVAARRIALLAQREDIDHEISQCDALLIEAVAVGDTITVGDTPAFRVQRKRSFSVDVAKRVVPAQLLQAATVPTLDVKALRALMPPALTDRCMVEGKAFVGKLASR